MATRCHIEVKAFGKTYKLYRHSDGYPEGVLSDLRVFLENYERARYYDCFLDDAEYLLSNFSFLAKLSGVLEGIRWDIGYGVCSPKCEHWDTEWKYVLRRKGVTPMIAIYRKEFGEKPEDDRWVLEFDGTLAEAIDKWGWEFPEGCHIRKHVFEFLKQHALV